MYNVHITLFSVTTTSTTMATDTVVLDAECKNYKVLDDARRHYTQRISENPYPENINLCDSDTAGSGLTYKGNWEGRNFYRIMGPAGSKIREGCVPERNACTTWQQGYISSGTHPTIPNQRATLTVCFKNGYVCPPSNCIHSIDIEVINCGSYFVYDLLSTDRCSYAYCSE